MRSWFAELRFRVGRGRVGGRRSGSLGESCTAVQFGVPGCIGYISLYCLGCCH